MQAEIQYIGHIKQDLSLNAWVHPTRGLRVWGRGQNSTFLEYGHVAYQIKGNDANIDMITNILSIDLWDPGLGSKGQNVTFSEHGQINGNGESSNMPAHILSLHTHSTPGWGQRSNFFTESSHVAYQIN